MDQERFDALTKALAGGASRRGVLKGLGGGLAALTAGVLGRGVAGANPPPKHCKYQGSNCNGNADCCTLNCCNRTCCGDGQVCTNGQCTFAPTPTPTPTTTPVPTTTTPTPTTTTTPAPNKCGGVTCKPLDQCHVAGTCDPATGACSNPVVADGTTCQTGGGAPGSCQSGTCVASNSCPVGGDICTGSLPGCGNNGACGCLTDVAGGNVCVNPQFGGCVPCMADADCGAGKACVVASCCGGTACIALC